MGQAEIAFPTAEPAALAKLKEASELAPIKAIREAVSPWLWVTSVVGFGLALLNTRRIARMYSGWREKSSVKRRTA